VSNGALVGLTVLVTRPTAQQSAFIAELKAEGARTESLPCLSIEPPDDLQAAIEGLQQAQSADALIFTSANAVEFAHALSPMPWTPEPSRLLAIGPATVTRLRNYAMEVWTEPESPYNSEALLRLQPVAALLQRNQLQNISLIKGQGGRLYLRDSLMRRGVKVDSVDVYRRECPIIPDATIARVFLNSPPDIVTITSDEALKNLVAIAGLRYQAQLLQLPLVVNSERSAALALQLGFQSQILVAPYPGDSGQLAAIKRWIRSYRHKL